MEDDNGGFCLLHPAGVDKDAVLQDDVKEGRVDDFDGGLSVVGVGGAVVLLDEDLYQDGTFSLSILAWILFWYWFISLRALSGI